MQATVLPGLYSNLVQPNSIAALVEHGAQSRTSSIYDDYGVAGADIEAATANADVEAARHGQSTIQIDGGRGSCDSDVQNSECRDGIASTRHITLR